MVLVWVLDLEGVRLRLREETGMSCAREESGMLEEREEAGMLEAREESGMLDEGK